MIRLTIILLLFISAPGWSQTRITWDNLSDVSFTPKYFKEVDEDLLYPSFGASVRALDGEEVYIQGYMLPMAPDEDCYILSRFPFAACFFCGGSGPESVVELQLKPDHPEFDMDQVVTIRGRLRLNQDDINYCNYILEEAEVYEE